MGLEMKVVKPTMNFLLELKSLGLNVTRIIRV